MRASLLWALTVLSLQGSSLTCSLPATEPVLPLPYSPRNSLLVKDKRNSFSSGSYPREFVYNLPFYGIFPSKPILQKPELCVYTYTYMFVYGLGFWNIRARERPRQFLVILPHHIPALEQWNPWANYLLEYWEKKEHGLISQICFSHRILLNAFEEKLILKKGGLVDSPMIFGSEIWSCKSISMPIPEYWPVNSFTKDTIPVILKSNESCTSYDYVNFWPSDSLEWHEREGGSVQACSAVCGGRAEHLSTPHTPNSASQT